MKKTLTVLVAIFCLCSLLVFPTKAATDPMAERFQAELGLLDHFYDYDLHYMIRKATDHFIANDVESWWTPTSVSAAEFDAVLHKYFVITDDQIEQLRELGNRDYYTEIWDDEIGEIIEVIPFFDADTQTYTFTFYGGFGGTLADRQYLGYVNNGSTYDVYYQHITYGYLCDVLPEGTSEDEYAESLGYPLYIEYNGHVYEQSMDGYTAILSLDDYGRKYTVEVHSDDVVRIISCIDYTASDLPDQFSDRTQVDVQVPADSGITIPDNNNFPGGTVVSAETVTSETVTNAMANVASKYVAYDFTATLDGQQVQPSGNLEVTFTLPADFSTDVAVYYLAEDGTMEAMNVQVDAETRTAMVQLTHFSIYILVDNASAVHQHQYQAQLTAPTCKDDGYTTFTCSCGDSYTADTVPATGEHTYGDDQKCTGCGAVNPNATEPAPEPTPKPDDSNKPSQPDGNDGDCCVEESSNNGIVIVVIIAAVVVVGVIVFFVIRKKK